MTQVPSRKNRRSFDANHACIDVRRDDPTYQVIDVLDNTWSGQMAPYDGGYSESHDIPNKELRHLTMILKKIEMNIAIVRAEFERRLNAGS
jgi:hypothetical protein